MENEKEIEEQIAQLKDSLATISSELKTITLNIQKRKTENTTLKVLLYTGLIVLLLGFFYTSSTLQRAQMDSLESSIHTLQTLMNRELMSVEKNVYGKIDRLETSSAQGTKDRLQERLATLSLALSRLNPDDERIANLIERVKQDSERLQRAYQKSRKEPETNGKNTDAKNPGTLGK